MRKKQIYQKGELSLAVKVLNWMLQWDIKMTLDIYAVLRNVRGSQEGHND